MYKILHECAYAHAMTQSNGYLAGIMHPDEITRKFVNLAKECQEYEEDLLAAVSLKLDWLDLGIRNPITIGNTDETRFFLVTKCKDGTYLITPSHSYVIDEYGQTYLSSVCYSNHDT
jgi:hypothetical protein